MNKIIIIGNITKDPETFEINEKVKANFSVAVNYGKDNVDYFNVVCWDKIAENVEKYLKKGSKVGVSGSIHNRSYEKDGKARYITEITAENIEFLSGIVSEEEPEKKEEKTEKKTVTRRR